MGMGMGRAWAWAWVGHGHGHLFILVRGLACFSGLGGLAHDTGGAGGHLFPGRPVVLLSLGTGGPSCPRLLFGGHQARRHGAKF
jgi:hypothetical protein